MSKCDTVQGTQRYSRKGSHPQGLEPLLVQLVTCMCMCRFCMCMRFAVCIWSDQQGWLAGPAAGSAMNDSCPCSDWEPHLKPPNAPMKNRFTRSIKDGDLRGPQPGGNAAAAPPSAGAANRCTLRAGGDWRRDSALGTLLPGRPAVPTRRPVRARNADECIVVVWLLCFIHADVCCSRGGRWVATANRTRRAKCGLFVV